MKQIELSDDDFETAVSAAAHAIITIDEFIHNAIEELAIQYEDRRDAARDPEWSIDD